MLKKIKSLRSGYGLEKRFRKTLSILETQAPPKTKILDLGTPNKLSALMKEKGYEVFNTSGEDLDLNPEIVKNFDADMVTAFEIFEHIVNPFGVLREIKAKKLFATVPLRLWFSSAYRNPKEEWDRHYHEFEDWQFDWLLEKSGWKIIERHKWTNPVYLPGIRPVLRSIMPRYYGVIAENTRL